MNAVRSNILIWSMIAALAGCGGNNTSSPVAAPGAQKDAATRTLEMGAVVMQDKAPIEAINVYLDGFHFYSGNMQQQMEAHHYCSLLNEEVRQCVIFDGNGKDAKLMGVEYIIGAEQFASLPAQEKKLWHSHAHEVRSGQLIAPGIPQAAEHELMTKIASTYGKTWHTWHTDQHHTLPVGIPQLMMGFTMDGQLQQQLLSQRDQRFAVETATKRADRSDISFPSVDVAANAWQHGPAMQLQLATLANSPATR
jgi:hypothetical protein